MCACPLMGLLWPVSRFDLLVDWTVIGLKSHSQARKTEGGMQTARGASGVRLASWNDAAAGRTRSVRTLAACSCRVPPRACKRLWPMDNGVQATESGTLQFRGCLVPPLKL